MSVSINNPSTTSRYPKSNIEVCSHLEKNFYCQYWFWVSNAIFIIIIFLIISINVNYFRLVIFRSGTIFPHLHVFWYLNFPIFCTTIVPCPSCLEPCNQLLVPSWDHYVSSPQPHQNKLLTSSW